MNTYLVVRNGEQVQVYFADDDNMAQEYAEDIDGFLVDSIVSSGYEDYDYVMYVR